MSLFGDHPESSDLITRSLDGDATAFEILLHRYGTRLLLFLRRNGGRALGPDSDEEDLLQIVIQRSWQLLPDFQDRGPGSFYAWVLALARSTISDRLKYLDAKGRGKVCHIESSVLAKRTPIDSQTTATHLLIRSEEVTRLHSAINSLPPDERQVIESHLLNGLTLQQIATATGMSKTSTWNRLQSGLVRLQGTEDNRDDVRPKRT